MRQRRAERQTSRNSQQKDADRQQKDSKKTYNCSLRPTNICKKSEKKYYLLTLKYFHYHALELAAMRKRRAERQTSRNSQQKDAEGQQKDLLRQQKDKSKYL